MKTLITILILTASFTTGRTEDGRFTKKQEQALTRFNACYDSLYVNKNAKDSLSTFKNMKYNLTLLDK